MRFFQQIVALWRRATRRYAGTNKRLYITIHETANPNDGADAQAHANLQSRGNVRTASWHEQVDDREAIQSYLDTDRCFHAGDGRGNGNLNSYAIEICVNRDGDYIKAVQNAATRTRQLMAQHGIPLSRVVQHNHWSGKNCPTFLRSGSQGIGWNDFLALVAGSPVTVSNPKPTPSTPSNGRKVTVNVTMRRIDLSRADSVSVTGDDVGQMQGLLMAQGYGPKGLVDPKTGRPDKIGGTLTKSWFRQFQKDHPHTGTNGKPDDVCGPASWTELIQN
ncbi:N-acetylmuramoyl-L-alanine amidase [Demequina sp. TTPB684]|uniref:peptidoglycan recognition protein family protein n=1 Tax=unclassified Demequina TaxID=2620311 RepID=UPI001CF2D5A0|nr:MULTISPECIES: N-acetylmuramoyl-L-alanine amidase [unclassified Demequina]MCB2411779.1 N-acetylmuramoyl-L-alanine amidase [Demequina sp. TTPB684]UPU89008.1 N-acetylmuramoyl-L-alanine amidase [Demequina sp. TMPB413]